METNRSKGVTFWAWCFIILSFGNIILFFYALNNANRFLWPAVALATYNFILAIILLILGINVLRLNEWSRKGVIYYHIAVPIMGILINFCIADKIYFQAGFKSAPNKSLAEFILILFSLIVIYFFTRPKVKEQFGVFEPLQTGLEKGGEMGFEKLTTEETKFLKEERKLLEPQWRSFQYFLLALSLIFAVAAFLPLQSGKSFEEIIHSQPGLDAFLFFLIFVFHSHSRRSTKRYLEIIDKLMK